MNINHINKYLLKEIFSFIDSKRELNLIKYNKKLMSKLDITLYTYQKYCFLKLINPASLEDKSLMLKYNFFDKQTLNKLYADFENYKTSIYDNIDLFNKTTNITKFLKNPKKMKPNLLELNLSEIQNLELYCIILTNLEKLSLNKITHIKFIADSSNITLNKLKYLYLNIISFEENQNININVDNLIYLDIRLKGIEGKRDEEEKENDFISVEDDDFEGVPKIFNTLQHLVKIFNFNFLSIYLAHEEEIPSGWETLDKRFVAVKNIFKDPNELFNQKNIINNLNYFNFNISYELNLASGSYEMNNKFICKYLFTKTKNEKYLFTTHIQSNLDGDDGTYKIIQTEYRICDNKNYNQYLFKNKDMTILSGFGKECFDDEELTDEDYNIHSFLLLEEPENEDEENSDEKYNRDGCNISMEFLCLLDNIKKDNVLEIIELDYLDIKEKQNSFFKNIKNLNKLKLFKINKNCLLRNALLITLLECLSKLKYLSSIVINFKQNLKLTKKEKGKIDKLFPNISIKKNDKSSSIDWNCS